MSDKTKKDVPVVSMAGDVKDGDHRLKKAYIGDMDPTLSSQDPLSQIFSQLKKNQDLKAIQLSFNEDPIRSADYSTVYKKRATMIPNLLLKRVRDSEEMIGGVILPLKANQVSLFGRPRPNRFDIGFTINIKPEIYEQYKDEEIEKIKKDIVPKLREIILNCGRNSGLKDREKSTFSQFLKMIVEDVYIFGWWATEIRKDHAGNFHSFRPVDAGTIYFATPTKEKSQEAANIRKQAAAILAKLQGHIIPVQAFANGDYTWVQAVEETPYQVFTDEQLIVWSLNPSTDIFRSGYPTTTIERMINSITTHINLTTHNKMFFLNGRAAKSIMVFKSDNLDDQDIVAIRQQMANHINTPNAAWRLPVFGISPKDEITIQPMDSGNRDMEFQYLADLNKRMILAAFQVSPDEIASLAYLSRGTNSQSLSECLDFSTQIITSDGIKSIKDLLGTENSVNTMIWSGTKWVESRVFKTGPKRLMETVLSNGLSIQTSPDHYFYTVGDSGTPEWKPRALLTTNDYVLVNKKEVKDVTPVPEYNNQKITPDLMEVLGWLTGDGNIVSPRSRAGGVLSFFYHHEKEQEIQERHFKILESFGFSPKNKKRTVSDEEREEIKQRYGFKSVASVRLVTKLYDTDFVNWLYSMGFTSSTEGKTIPSILYTLPSEYKYAFLRGLFSADGGINRSKNGTPILTISNEVLKSQVISLLNSIGIRVNPHQGSTKQVFLNTERQTVKASNKLYIKDKRLFFEKIGFLQDHKQPLREWLNGSDPYEIPQSVQDRYFNYLLSKGVNKSQVSYLKTSQFSGNKLKELLNSIGETLPEWMDNFHCVQVQNLIEHNQIVEMADVTVFEDSHAFSANGIIVHNSNNEWKLLKSQESGLRPLLNSIEDFLNERLLPKINPDWAKIVSINFQGLDADSPEKEATLLSQASSLYYTFNDILDKVEKDRVDIGGDFPMNAAYLQVLEKYFTMGQILKRFEPEQFPEADKDPNLAFYIGNPAWFQFKQMQLQEQQMAQQQKQLQQQPQGGQPGQPPQPGQPQQPDQEAKPGQPEQEQSHDLDSAVGQLAEMIGKSELTKSDSPMYNKNQLKKQHKKMKDKIMSDFEKQSKNMVDEILIAISGTKPKE